MLATFLSAIGIVLVLSALILIHEFGHFIAAKRSGVWVEEFGIGLPPRAFGKKIGVTIYSVNWLPFGGFVRLHGEMLEDSDTVSEKSFMGKSKLTRAKIIVAGIFMNLILAWACFAIVYSFLGVPKEQGYVQVVEVLQGSPAESAGLKANDIILSFNGKEVKKSGEFTKLTKENAGQEITVKVKRDDQTLDLKTNLRPNPEDGRSYLGIVVGSETTYYPPVWQRPFYGAYYGTIVSYQTTLSVFQGLGMTASSLTHGQTPKDTVGPVGILAVIYVVLKQGILPVLNLMGLISINLAVINILPIPALDGGRLLFIIIEAIFGKKVLPKFENAFHTAGFIVLITLILFISFFDVRKIITAGGFTNFVNSFGK